MTHSHEGIHVCPMSLARHHPRDVAALIYASAPELFTLLYGPWAVAQVTRLVERSHNRFSYQYLYIAEKEQQVVGIATLVPVAVLSHEIDEAIVFHAGQQLWLKWVRSLVLRHVLHDDYPPGSLYVGNLAVAAEHRNQGIGRQLVTQCIAAAHATKSPLYISVDIHNPRAQKLYESLGFQVIGTKTLTLLGSAIGSRLLVLPEPS